MDTSIRVLIVDDFSTMRRIVRKLLGNLGLHYVEEADNGRTALPMLQSGRFDLLITDWAMPLMPGIDLLRAVRRDPELAGLPVLMVTAESKREHIVAAAEAGVDAYLVKPFTAATLSRKLEQVLAAAPAPA